MPLIEQALERSFLHIFFTPASVLEWVWSKFFKNILLFVPRMFKGRKISKKPSTTSQCKIRGIWGNFHTPLADAFFIINPKSGSFSELAWSVDYKNGQFFEIPIFSAREILVFVKSNFWENAKFALISTNSGRHIFCHNFKCWGCFGHTNMYISQN